MPTYYAIGACLLWNRRWLCSKNIGKFQFNNIITPEIQNLLKNTDAKKAEWTDEIRPKLVTLSATVFHQPLADAINNSISKGVFLTM